MDTKEPTIRAHRSGHRRCSGTPTQAVPPVPAISKSWVLWQIVGRMTLMGLGRGAAFGALFGVFFWIIGALYGLVFGGLVGLMLGLADGFVLAALTVRRFYPLVYVGPYRRVIGTISIVVCLIGGPLGFATVTGGLFGGDRDLLYALTQDWLFTLIPSAIAAVAIWMASQKLAFWYEEATRRRA